MTVTRNGFLIAAATLSAVAALLHVGILIFGAPWYRFFGAGERMAELAASGHWYPTLITSLIALVLVVWAMYALAGAGGHTPAPANEAGALHRYSDLLASGSRHHSDPRVRRRAWRHRSGSGARLCVWFYGLVHLLGLKQVWARL